MSIISDYTDFCPLYCQPGHEGSAVSQFDKDDVEAAGLVKFDFLGLKTLTVVESCCQLVRNLTGEDFRIHTIPLDDPATFALLCRVEAVGIFQLESIYMVYTCNISRFFRHMAIWFKMTGLYCEKKI